MPYLRGRASYSLYVLIVLLSLFVLSACNRISPVISPEPFSDEILETDTEDSIIDKGNSQQTTFQSIQGSANAHIEGAWSEAANWPLIAIHAILLPNGHVLSYGTQLDGKQGANFHYDVWNPSLGLGSDSHTVLENKTGTDIFCSAQAIIPSSGQVLITGGDVTIDGKRNYSSSDFNFFDFNDLSLQKSPLQLTTGRWYPTLTTLPSGELLLHGGRSAPGEPVLMPEIYSPDKGWRFLPGAESEAAYGGSRYYYPWSFVTPSGKVLLAGKDMWYLDPTGEGNISFAGTRDNLNRISGSAVMFAEGKILVVGGGATATNSAVVIDVNNDTPQISSTSAMHFARSEIGATVLPTGDVLITGGSAQRNKAEGVAYHAEIWNPVTEEWTLGAPASKMRLYHSTSILLPDGTLLTAGGGSPGPVRNLNAEIYYPPYLFKKDGSGDLADRPVLSDVGAASYNQSFSARFSNATSISKVSLVRAGSATHAWDMEQRFVELNFSQSGTILNIQAPERPELAPPGYYMLFAIDEDGVPSEAQMLHLAPKPMLQAGSFNLRQVDKTSWTTINFDQVFSESPVVVVSPPSYKGSQPSTMRIRNVNEMGFEVQLDEWDYLDGRHITETLFYLAMEPGQHDLGGIIAEAGHISADSSWSPQTFTTEFNEVPMVFTQVSSDNELDAVAPRLKSVSTLGFDLRLQEQELSDRLHAAEDIHYFAFSTGTASFKGQTLKVGYTGLSVGHDWHNINFDDTFVSAHFLANTQTYIGNNPMALRYRNLSENTVQIFAEEEQSRDSEKKHVKEGVAWLVLSQKDN